MPPEPSYAEVAAQMTNGVSDHSDSDTTATEIPKDLEKRGYNLARKKNIENDPVNKPFCNSIPEAQVTLERKSYIPQPNDLLTDPGTPRATLAASKESPNGTIEDDWARKHQHQTVILTYPQIHVQATRTNIVTGPATTRLLLGSIKHRHHNTSRHLSRCPSLGLVNPPLPYSRPNNPPHPLLPYRPWSPTRPLLPRLSKEYT
jgi:hypothetical protein